GSIALILAGRHHPRVDRVVAVNPYDYAKGRGIARSSWLGWLMAAAADFPVVGETFMRLRSFPIMKAVFRGGVAGPATIPAALLTDMNRLGSRHGHYRAFLSLLRHAASWERATEVYQNINVPVRLVWGDRDWAMPSEREHDRGLIPGVQMATVERS